MLAHDGIIFALHHFFGQVPRVFAGYIEKTGVRGADEFDFYIGWFRHGAFLKKQFSESASWPKNLAQSAVIERANAESSGDCQEKAAIRSVRNCPSVIYQPLTIFLHGVWVNEAMLWIMIKTYSFKQKCCPC